MAATYDTPLSSKLVRELVLLAVLLFLGVVLLPVAIWVVGGTLFGDYDGNGYMDFFGTLATKLIAGDGAAWFLVLSPYLGIGALRLTAWGWRQAAGGRK